MKHIFLPAPLTLAIGSGGFLLASCAPNKAQSAAANPVLPTSSTRLAATPVSATPVSTPKNTSTKDASKPARYGVWRSSHIGGGGFLQNVVFTSNPQVLYSYMDVGGVFRSDDGGLRWRMIHGSMRGNGSGVTDVRDISVDPKNPDVLLAASGTQWAPREGVYRSVDAGKSWNRVLDAWFYGNENNRWMGRALIRNPKNPQIVLAHSGGDGIFRSIDGGLTWKNVGIANSYNADIKFARDGKTAFACAVPEAKMWREKDYIAMGGGFFASTDGGATWRKIADKSPTEMIEDPQRAGRWWGIFGGKDVRVSDDNGETWRDNSQGLPRDGNVDNFTDEGKFEALASGPNFLLTASSRGTFYRLDLPATSSTRFPVSWKKLATPKVTEIYEGRPWVSRMQPGKWPHFGASLASISVDPRNAKRWFFTDWYAIYRSEDAGASWTLSIDGIEGTVIHTLVADPKNAGRVHLGMADLGYMTSTDNASSFQSPVINSNMKSLAVCAGDSRFVYGTGDEGNGNSKWEASQIWSSGDSGQNWKRLSPKGLPSDAKFGTIVVAPASPKTVYVAASGEVKSGAGGVYKSVDGGQTWTWASEGLEGGACFADNIFGARRELSVLDSGEMLAVSNKRSKTYRLAAGATRWESVDGNGGNDIDSFGGAFYVAASWNGVWRFQNGASSQLWKGNASSVAVDDKNRVAVGASDGVYLSRDGGATWNLQGGLPHRFDAVVALAGERLLAGTRGNGAFWMPLGATTQTAARK